MSLAQIKEKIRSDAQQEAEAILKKADDKVQAIQERTQEEIKRLEGINNVKINKECPEIYKRRKIVADLDVKRLVLGAKRRLIQDAFNTALEELIHMDRDTYLLFCENMLKNAIETGDEELRISPKDQFIDSSWVHNFNKKYSKQLTLSDKKVNISGGFLLVQGRIITNCSWESLIQIMRENRETDVVKRLFPA